MARVDEVKRENLDARQQQLYDDIMRTRPRGKLSGPFSVWMHTPDIAEPANGLANCFRVNAQTRQTADRIDHFADVPRGDREICLVGA